MPSSSRAYAKSCPVCGLELIIPSGGDQAACAGCGRVFALRRRAKTTDGAPSTGNIPPGGPAAAASIGDSSRKSSTPPIEKVRNLWMAAVGDGKDEGASLKPDTRDAEIRPTPDAPDPSEPRRRRVVRAGTPGVDDADFVVGPLLGQGGMGQVFRAMQPALGRNVAVKMIRTDKTGAGQAKTAAAQRKFLAEARITGRLEHPNIIPIYEFGATGRSEVFYAMKEVKGMAWSECMGLLGEVKNLDIWMRVADAVAFAHGRGIVHLDLKPANVMLGDFGEVLLMDWGLAAAFTPTSDGVGKLVAGCGRCGTPAYMAPEMAQGNAKKIGPKSDQYLLGGILYEILTGLRPHHGNSPLECLCAAYSNRLQESGRSDDLMKAARKAMAANPWERHTDVKALQQAVLNCREHMASLVLSTQADETLKRAKRAKDYSDYARAVFGFEEALRLWPKNKAANVNLGLARRAYARLALERGEYALALAQAGELPADEGKNLGDEVKARQREAARQSEEEEQRKEALERRREALEQRQEALERSRNDLERRHRKMTWTAYAAGMAAAVLLMVAATSHARIALARNQAENARTDLEATRIRAENAQTDLEAMRVRAENAQTDLEATRVRLKETADELSKTQARMKKAEEIEALTKKIDAFASLPASMLRAAAVAAGMAGAPAVPDPAPQPKKDRVIIHGFSKPVEIAPVFP